MSVLSESTTTSAKGACSIACLFGVHFVAILVFVIMRAWVPAMVLMWLWLAGFLLVGSGLVTRWLTNRLQRGVQPLRSLSFGTRAAVVLLGDGTTRSAKTGEIVPSWFAESRIAKAAEIYRAARNAGATCKVVVLGECLRGDGVGPNRVYPERLVALGVAATDIDAEQDGANTFQHARIAAEILGRESFSSVFLVTSGPHMRRALSYFAHFGVRPVAVPSDYVDAVLSWTPLAYNFAVADIACHQFLGIVRLHVYNFLGWNKAPDRK